MEPNDCLQHQWRLMETGYVRTWSVDIDPKTKTVTAYYSGSEDFSESGDGNDALECSLCLTTKEIPEGWEIDYQ